MVQNYIFFYNTASPIVALKLADYSDNQLQPGGGAYNFQEKYFFIVKPKWNLKIEGRGLFHERKDEERNQS